jgi:Asp-tRNA(Asn)/Glu-tRNA(Gln) amidotransferase A subunit family amidase
VSAAEPSALERLADLRDGRVSARELVEATLVRIDAADRDLNAVTERRDEEALAAADRADAERRAGGAGALLGLPLTIKDVLDVRGWRTSAGSLAREGHRAVGDAAVVARLRAGGAIVVAKTNVPECSCSFETDNVIHGRTDHPLDRARTPGGSSGGEAALLGADASIAGIGTDGGGSIRAPAHFTGIVGIRPTVGRTPETGVWPATRATGMLDLTCVGPMARTVGDLALLLAIIAGADGVDPYAIDQPLGDPASVDARGLRVGFYTAHPAVPRTTAATIRAVRDAADALAHTGARVQEIPPPDAGIDVEGRSATELFFACSGADGGAHLRAAVAAAGGRHHPQFRAILGDPDAPDPGAAAFFAAQRRLFAYRAGVRAAIARHDVVLSPVVAGPAPPHGRPPADIAQERYLRYEAFEYCHISAVAGVPAAAVPVATEGGLPIGVQIAAPPWREDLALAAARVLEEAFGGFAINRRLAARRADG